MRISEKRILKPLRFITLMSLIICLCLTSMPIFAAADTKVYDFANLFSLEEVEKLESMATEVAEQYKMDIGIVTTDDAEGKSAQDYADDFYDYNGYGYGNDFDGLLFLIDMDNREIYISTCGLSIKYFTDLRISKMLDAAFEYVSNQDYYGAAYNFIENVKSYINTGVPSNQTTVEKDFSDPREDYNDPYMTEVAPKHIPFRNSQGEPLNVISISLSVVVALIIAGIIGFIVRAIVSSSYKNPHYTTPQTRPDHLSVHYTEKEDRFVTSHTSRIKIQTDNHGSGSGGHGGSGISSSHHSSSGNSHGGGGRSF